MIETSVGLFIHHDLSLATEKALNQAEKRLKSKPSGILYFTGTHFGGKEIYNQAMSIIKKKYPNTPLAGCSGIGIANNFDYGLKGAGIMLFSGISIQTFVTKRFRIGSARKTRKILKNCRRIKREQEENNSSTSFIFFPPGLGFPKFMVNLLNHRLQGFNPFFILNNRLWRKFPVLSKISEKFSNFFMDLFGIGISYSCAWPLFQKLFESKIQYTGTFGVDPLTMKKSYQFCNFKAYKDSITYISFSSSKLYFKSKTDTGAKIDSSKAFDLDSYLDGGFIPSIRGQWGAEALLKMYDMEKTPEILEDCTQKYFYYHPFKPLCIIDKEENKNLYGLSINPNLNHALITAPNQVAKSLNANRPNKIESYLCNQGGETIESLLKESLSDIVDEDVEFGLFFDCGNRAMIIGDRFKQYIDHYTKALSKKPFLVILSGGEVNSQSYPIVNFSLVSNILSRYSSI